MSSSAFPRLLLSTWVTKNASCCKIKKGGNSSVLAQNYMIFFLPKKNLCIYTNFISSLIKKIFLITLNIYPSEFNSVYNYSDITCFYQKRLRISCLQPQNSDNYLSSCQKTMIK